MAPKLTEEELHALLAIAGYELVMKDIDLGANSLYPHIRYKCYIATKGGRGPRTAQWHGTKQAVLNSAYRWFVNKEG